jgi:hypothetical protein
MSRALVAVAASPLLLVHLAHGDNGGAPYVSGGATVGLALHSAGTGGVFGGEVSAGYLLGDLAQPTDWHGLTRAAAIPWFGGYLDAVYDSQLAQARVTFGPEIGYGLVGLDGGLVVQSSHEGIAARLVVTTGVVAIYARYVHTFDTAGEANFVELGILLKYPHVFWPHAE